MCGIAGVVARAGGRPPSTAELLRMAAMLQHRGPDGHGIYRSGGAGLSHTRLSLVDLGGGAQPLHNEDRTLWLVGNGEIFDHVAQRAELEARGHRFATRCDVEVFLHAYEEWGEDAFGRLDAQFAIALWDARRQLLVLARDRFGILPLHYAVTADAVVFASEQKALFAGGRLAPAIDPDVVRQVFTYWSTPGPRAVFAGIRIVPPGSCVAFARDAAPVVRSWWQPVHRAVTAPAALPDAEAELERRLDAAVRIRLQADVPVAAYVSGGLDSSVLVALAARAGIRPITFSLGFDDPAFDESAPQRRVAALFGADHHEVRVGDADIRDGLADVVWHVEAPLLRTAPVPMFALSGLVRRHGIKAVLTGEGADELLAGYSIFLEDKVRRFAARRPESAARPALFSRVHEFVGTTAQRDSAMWRAFLGSGLGVADDPFAAHRLRWRNNAWTTRVLALPPVAPAVDDELLRALLPPHADPISSLARAQTTEIATFLTPYLLCCQGDRVAMAHGVEARYPFLAPAVAEHCLGLPDGHKLRGLVTKVALRHLAARLLPEDVWRRKKHPYRAPIARALLAPRDDLVGELLRGPALRANPLLDATAAGNLVTKLQRAPERANERECMALCGIVTLQLLRWHYIDQFAARAAGLAEALTRRPPQILVTDDPTTDAPR